MTAEEKTLISFKNLEIYLHSELYRKSESFYDEDNLCGSNVIEIDKENHIIKIFEFELLEYSLEWQVQHVLKQKTNDCEEKYKFLIIENVNDKGKIIHYKHFFFEQLEKSFNAKIINDFKFLQKYKDNLYQRLLTYPIKENIFSNSSPNPLIVTDKLTIEKAHQFYSLLIIEPALIDANEEDFIAAFSGGEVKDGIKWLVKGSKNRENISKPSLFYLMQELADNDFFTKDYYENIIKIIKYLFRDENGNCFKPSTLSASKYSASKNTSRKNDIDSIISSLL